MIDMIGFRSGRLVVANILIATGTLVLSAGGLLQGIADKDEAFVISLAAGIVVIYAGFLVASGATARLRAPTGPTGTAVTAS